MEIKSPILDSTQSIFFARQLEMIEGKLYETKYPELEAEMLLPNRVQVPAGVDKYTWRMFDGKGGNAVPMAGHEDGAPTVDVDGEESSTSLQSWVAGYRYNVEEIAAASFAGMPLEQMRAQRARRKLAEILNNMALRGDAVTGVKTGIKGLFNLANTLTYSVPTTGSGSTKTWSTKSADNILIDLFGMVDSIPNNTLDLEGGAGVRLNLVMPKANLRLISTVRLGTSAQDTTVLEFFKRQRPNVNIMGANYLPTAGSGSVSRTVCYDPTQVSWLGSIPFEQMPVEQEGFSFVINCRARGGGVITPYPKSVIYGDGM
jgi:hypothetical protein